MDGEMSGTMIVGWLAEDFVFIGQGCTVGERDKHLGDKVEVQVFLMPRGGVWAWLEWCWWGRNVGRDSLAD